MEKKVLITIGRQFGSGGSEVGRKLAENLGLTYYDKELLLEAAKDYGLSPEVFERVDEQTFNSFSYALSVGFSPVAMFSPNDNILSGERLFKFQSDTIRKIAEKESCVLIGRCADYVLRDNPFCISFFIHNKLENRIQRVIQAQHMTPDQAKSFITKTDKSRAAYYNYYTDKSWGVASSYNLSIDVSVLGIDETVLFLRDFIQKKKNTFL